MQISRLAGELDHKLCQMLGTESITAPLSVKKESLKKSALHLDIA